MCVTRPGQRGPAFAGGLGFTAVILWVSGILEEEHFPATALWATGIFLLSFLLLSLLYSLVIGTKNEPGNNGE